ncbi:hypothetical protein [Microbacterium sp. JZ31]|uniref:hypothetical protein n=1 Tax=Microbacterium sp. JZ31 TaxID=1906274 RepID=UPI0019328085|nr:hypothetical protein [Microbacterium sp. JZ31]
MRQLPTKILAVAAVALLAFLALLPLALVTSGWTALLLGVIGMCLLGLLLFVIREQRAASRAQTARLKAVEEAVRRRGVEQDNQIAETAARFDWIARRQAELLRSLSAAGDRADDSRRRDS